MTVGRALLAANAWLHFALVFWTCFLLPGHGDWMYKLESAGKTPLLLPLMTATLLAGWLCRDQAPLWVTAAILVLLDGMAWSSRWWP